MGKRITQQARGKGSLTFRVSPKAYKYKISYPKINSKGTVKIIKLLNSLAHSAPLAKININKETFFVPAANGIHEGQEIEIDGKPGIGNILKLKNIPIGTKVFNIEIFPGGGGKYIRSAGSSGIVLNKEKGKVKIQINKRKIELDENCRE